MSTILSRIQNAQQKSQVLIDALPWMREFSGARVVIKYGGNAMTSQELKHAFVEDVLFLHHAGLKPIVVHGGGPQINTMLHKMGIESKFSGGLRVTDDDTMNVVRMVLTGQVQRELVSLLNTHGPYAVGLSGEDAGLLQARRRQVSVAGKPINIGHVGDVTRVDPRAIEDLLESHRIPVISTVATDVDEPAEVLNVNADSAAAALAIAVRAKKFVMLTDVEGLYLNWPDKSTLVATINTDDAAALLPSLDSGMAPKIEAAIRAVDEGVERAHIIDGRITHSMLLEIFTNEGIGTLVSRDAASIADRVAEVVGSHAQNAGAQPRTPANTNSANSEKEE
ncbi:MAG: acetylglutamate kinase [Actinomycetaceae bacterium]|nr:acetylglutamate kinase [Arcanobacterium sp.]MDD7505322.1 acetylglutamate kinase [Actinomycetaceae bacterium]MDY6142959.1 acetylglutamate kinase [Arcanobacterium sp.]